mmetsp:Transcript_13639/g.25658  ORF Transcript_13639/g.25658 Transcript_13639/m.25658 type:complete len:157 (-) Transcript_13639:671-1141(-)|eukprot:CAMPEP_0176486184 /NCGR_PEP_ID=MMETSP0200_2-20121128/5433_1 /TAXON_ID=947934 /ORGANISM="Chaetoceros sp., Strain GSL56" /LENGTH=156 /DNA_ID=CAMNT_0017882869 /DNA_START=1069 /DNA_END=1539 /DNA_ORIENTATION=+
MQKASRAFLISIAAGSSENQDYELLNEKLEKNTGIKGIKASFQNINQSGTTQEFWKIANKKAMNVNENKNSKAHLHCKYKWSPKALEFFVPDEDKVDSARQTMINMFGKFKDEADPIGSDGSKMRFLLLKRGAIKSNRTCELCAEKIHLSNLAEGT